MNNAPRTTLAVVTVFGLLALPAAAVAQTTVTSFAPASNTTPGVWYEFAIEPGGTASIADLTGQGGNLELLQPLPIGAAKLTTDFTNDAKAEVGVFDAYGQPQNIFGSLQLHYSYLKASHTGQTNFAAAPSLKLAFFNGVCDETADEDCFGTLVYEPTWNGAGAPSPSNPSLDTWVRVNIDQNNGYFWWTGGFGQPNTAGGPPLRTLAEWAAILSPDFADANLSVVSVGVGTSNPGQIGYFDAVSISHAGFSASYDFEPAPQFETLGECVSTLVAENCSTLTGRARATCNHEQQMSCFDLFGIQ